MEFVNRQVPSQAWRGPEWPGWGPGRRAVVSGWPPRRGGRRREPSGGRDVRGGGRDGGQRGGRGDAAVGAVPRPGRGHDRVRRSTRRRGRAGRGGRAAIATTGPRRGATASAP